VDEQGGQRVGRRPDLVLGEAAESGATALTLVTWFDTMPAGSLRGLVLACDDLDAEYQRLHASGVPFDGPPQRQPWATEAVCRDPDGNTLVLQQA
jgi:predicted enzyme related to lactoylglutathione lyase